MAIKGFGIERLFGQGDEGTTTEGVYVAEPPPSLQRKTPPPGTKILIVDDSKTIHVMLTKTLQGAGYEPLSAFDGESALAMLSEQRPALVLMDVVMPGMSGFEATRLIRKNGDAALAHTPVLMISGNEQPTEEFWSIKIGANGFLAKPFEDSELFGHIEALLFPALVVQE